MAAVLCLASTGCSRQFWRHQADRDAYDAISDRLTDPRWAVPRIDLQPDPSSRFFDPNDPDHAPLPPDDPAAHAYMHWVDGWEGYKGWHRFGDEMSVENPQWIANFAVRNDLVDPLTGEPMPPTLAIEDLGLDDAIELSLIHNRVYQTRLEDVYLAAMDVTFQRFQFNVRYLGIGGGEPNAAVTHRLGPGDGTDSTSGSMRFGVRKVLPAGTQIAMELANNTLWLFSGGNQTQSASVLSYSITQPLLIGAGRKIGLENLTDSERNLLYATRDLARFRQTFFTDTVGGYLGLLTTLQGIRNEQGNIRRLEDQTDRLMAEATRGERAANSDLAAFPDGVVIPPELAGQLVYREDLQRLFWRGLMSDEQEEMLRNLSQEPGFKTAAERIIQSLRTTVAPLDVLNLQSSLVTSVNNLRSSQLRYQDQLDAFKLQLGLPPDMKLTIDNTLLKQFEVISGELFTIEDEAKEFAAISGVLDDESPDLIELRLALQKFSELLGRAESIGMKQVSDDVASVEAAIPIRLAELQTDEDRKNLTADFERARFLYQEASEKMLEIRRALAGFQETVRSDNIGLDERLEAYNGLTMMREDLLRLMQNLQVVQISMRIELISLIPVDVSLEEATANAIENRVDLMNSRAMVMDARRQVEITANRMQAALDLVVDGDIRTAGGNRPFNFNGESSQMRAGIRFTAPLDQITERNNYRVALLRYQRQRRAYMQAEDEIKQDVRQAWRQIIVLRKNFETTRRAVRLAALQYDSAVNEANAPAGQGQGGGRGLQGNNLLNALSAILRAQNALIQNWTNYEQNRLNIYRDMGTMEVGPDGLWNDPFYRNQDNASDEPAQIRLQSPSLDRFDAVPGDGGGGHVERVGVAQLIGTGE
ncbi:MAG: TolC family protein [Planctomycetaceae bacterium]|nr:TolC family protein [Planctomycetaceae bacterium]